MTERITYKKAREMMKEEKSLFFSVSRQEHLALHPKYVGDLKKGVSTMLDSFMSLYLDRFDGVPLAYSNVKLLQNHAALISYQPYLHFDVTAEFIVFKPMVGCSLKGVIQKVESSHVSCLVHGTFNAWCPKQPLEQAFKDSDPLALIGCEIEFTVNKLSSNGGVLSMRGDFKQILKKRTTSLKAVTTETTPASTNTRKTFDSDNDSDEGISDMPGTPGLNETFSPNLCSTQIQTPCVPSTKQRKRKLSNHFDLDTSIEQESSKGNSEDTEFTQLKKKKKKKSKDKDKHETVQVNGTEVNDSMEDFVSDVKTKSMKKKKKKSKKKETE